LSPCETLTISVCKVLRALVYEFKYRIYTFLVLHNIHSKLIIKYFKSSCLRITENFSARDVGLMGFFFIYLFIFGYELIVILILCHTIQKKVCHTQCYFFFFLFSSCFDSKLNVLCALTIFIVV